MESFLVALLGFIYGFVGLPLLFFLVWPVVRRLSTLWDSAAIVSRWVAAVTVFCFLLLLCYGSAGSWLDLISRGDEAERIRLGKKWAVWMCFGLAVYALLPRCEMGIRRLLGSRQDDKL